MPAVSSPRHQRISAIGLLVALSLGGAVAVGVVLRASDCRPSEPICHDFWAADAVFVARVSSLGEPPGRFRVDGPEDLQRLRLEVREVFRGDRLVRAGTTLELPTWTGLRVGETYVVYAHLWEGRLVVGACGRTALVAAASEDLAYARGLAASRPTAARVFGETAWDQLPSGTRLPADGRLPRVTLVLRGGGVERRIESDGAGHFDGRLPPGRYAAHAEVPAPYRAEVKRATLSIPDARACERISVQVNFDGGVTGRVVDAAGQPVAGLLVHRRSPAQGRPFTDMGWTRTGEDGRFQIAGLGPGHHDLRFGEDLLPAASLVPEGMARPTVSIPIERAIRLDPGQRVDLGTLALPATAPARVTIRGRVVDAAGTPLQNVLVSLAEAGRDPGFAQVHTDRHGSYLFAAVRGRRYYLETMMVEDAHRHLEPIVRFAAFEAGHESGPFQLLVNRPKP